MLAILAKPRYSEIGLKIGYRAAKDMEVGIEQECEGPNWAELHLAMAQGTIFISASSLIVLSIISQGHKHLEEEWGGETKKVVSK